MGKTLGKQGGTGRDKQIKLWQNTSWAIDLHPRKGKRYQFRTQPIKICGNEPESLYTHKRAHATST